MSLALLERRVTKAEAVALAKPGYTVPVLVPDLTVYAPEQLRIRTKTGGIESFVFNRAQRYIHDKLEEQKGTTGKVRALILKGRQQGCSTYVAGRFYHRVTHAVGLRCFILTHEDAATQNLFEMVNRYHEHVDDAVRPRTGAANAKELNFADRDSGYKVGTAGTKGAGRSSTVQLFHGSSRLLAERRQPCGWSAPGRTGSAGNRGHPGEHRERHRQLLPPDMAGG